MNRILRFAPGLATAAIFLFVALASIARMEISIDESTQIAGIRADLAQCTRWLLGADPYQFGTVPDRMSPLSYWAGHVWAQIFGGSEVSLRAMSSLFTALAIFVTAQTAARISGPKAGVIAGLLFALCPHTLERGTEIRPYAMFMFFAAVSFDLYVRLLMSKGVGRALLWRLAATLALASATHFFGAVMTGALVTGWVVLAYRKKVPLTPALVLIGVQAVTLIALSPFILASTKVMHGRRLETAGVFQLYAWFADLFSQASIRTSFVAGLLVVLSFGVLALVIAKRALDDEDLVRPLVIGLAAAVAVVVVGNFATTSIEVAKPRYSVWMSPFVFALIAEAAADRGLSPLPALWRRSGRIATVVLGIIYLFGTVLFATHVELFSTTAADRVLALIPEKDYAKTLVIHESSDPNLYFILNFKTDKRLPHAEYQEKVSPHRHAKILPPLLDIVDGQIRGARLEDYDRILVLANWYLGSRNIGEIIRGTAEAEVLANKPAGPIAVALTQTSTWAPAGHHFFTAINAADVRIFEKKR